MTGQTGMMKRVEIGTQRREGWACKCSLSRTFEVAACCLQRKRRSERSTARELIKSTKHAARQAERRKKENETCESSDEREFLKLRLSCAPCTRVPGGLGLALWEGRRNELSVQCVIFPLSSFVFRLSSFVLDAFVFNFISLESTSKANFSEFKERRTQRKRAHIAHIHIHQS